jgi:hypothetical protein
MWIAWHLCRPEGGAYAEGSMAHIIPDDANVQSGQVRTACGRRVPGDGEAFEYHYDAQGWDHCSRCEKKAAKGS